MSTAAGCRSPFWWSEGRETRYAGGCYVPLGPAPFIAQLAARWSLNSPRTHDEPDYSFSRETSTQSRRTRYGGHSRVGVLRTASSMRSRPHCWLQSWMLRSYVACAPLEGCRPRLQTGKTLWSSGPNLLPDDTPARLESVHRRPMLKTHGYNLRDFVSLRR